MDFLAVRVELAFSQRYADAKRGFTPEGFGSPYIRWLLQFLVHVLVVNTDLQGGFLCRSYRFAIFR